MKTVLLRNVMWILTIIAGLFAVMSGLFLIFSGVSGLLPILTALM